MNFYLKSFLFLNIHKSNALKIILKTLISLNINYLPISISNQRVDFLNIEVSRWFRHILILKI